LGLAAPACERSAAPSQPPEVPADVVEDGEAGPAADAPAVPRPDACAELEPEDCAAQATLVLRSDDASAAVAMLEWACEAGAQDSCRTLGLAFYEGADGIEQDYARARELFDGACAADDAAGCYYAGLMLHEGAGQERDPVASAAAFERACALDEGEGCKNAGVLHLTGELGPDGPSKAVSLFEAGCRLDEPESCFNLGVVLAKGQGVAPDEAAAVTAMSRACELGDADGCAAAEDLAAAADPNAVASANIRMGSIEVDGMVLTNLECRASGGGLFGTLALLATLGENKKAFDKCAPKGAAPTVRWDFTDSKTEVLAVEDPSSKVAACVEKVMKKIPATMPAQCRATLLIGDRKGAEAAAKRG
jgi:TPR repeat protein